MQETQVRALGWEDPLEKGTVIHSSTLAWKIPWMEEPGGLQSMRLQSRTQLSDLTFTFSPTVDISRLLVRKFPLVTMIPR